MCIKINKNSIQTWGQVCRKFGVLIDATGNSIVIIH